MARKWITVDVYSKFIEIFLSKEGLNESWRRGGLVASALDSGASVAGSSPGRGQCVVFLRKTLYSHSASLHPGVQMGGSKYAGVTLRWTSIPFRGE